MPHAASQGVITIEVPAGTLRGRADLDLDSPLLVRVASIERRDDVNIHELEFIGTTPGLFDLREVLVFADGSAIDLLPPLPVQIVSNLEDHAASDLSMTIPPSTTFVGGYRIWIIVIGVLWILIPVITIICETDSVRASLRRGATNTHAGRTTLTAGERCLQSHTQYQGTGEA